MRNVPHKYWIFLLHAPLIQSQMQFCSIMYISDAGKTLDKSQKTQTHTPDWLPALYFLIQPVRCTLLRLRVVHRMDYAGYPLIVYWCLYCLECDTGQPIT